MPTKTTSRFPAEWEKQSAVMLTWPHQQSDWGPILDEVEPVFVELAKQITQHEKLLIICFSSDHQQHIQQQLLLRQIETKQISYILSPSNDTWARDHGPITVLHNDHPLLLNFIFNGWGNKHDAELDNQINQNIYQQNGFGKTPMESVPLVMEGGGLETDGQGTLLTTSHCLLSPQRNPQLTKRQIEESLQQWLGTDRVLWLDHGYLAGDDTDSHIDTLARFCDAHTITYVACSDINDEHYNELKEMEKQLQAFNTREGNPYQLLPLPWPQAKYDQEGQRLPASYANFLIINDAVLVPTYDDPADEIALAVIQQGFPHHKITPIPCLPLIQQFGSLHCVTMQLPEGVIS